MPFLAPPTEAAYSASRVEFRDDFNRASLGSLWTNASGASISSSKMVFSAGGGGNPILLQQPSSVDHFAEIDVTTFDTTGSGNHAVGLFLRSTSTVSSSYLAQRVYASSGAVNRWIISSTGTLATSTSNLPTAPWRMRFEARQMGQGVLLSLYEQVSGAWVLRLSYSDPSTSVHNFPFYVGINGNNVTGSVIVDNFTSGIL